MCTHGWFARGRGVSRGLAAALAVFLILSCAPRCFGEQPTTIAVMTDTENLPASDRFGVPNQFSLAGTGDVFFTSGGNTALFSWNQAAGTPTRLLQTNDPLDVLGLGLPEEYAGSLVDATGTLLQVNAAGHAAFVASAAIKGEYDPAGIFVYDGSSYRMVDTPVSIFTQLLLNNNDRVAVLGNRGVSTLDPQGIYAETDSGVVTIAEQGQPIPPNPAGLTGMFGTLQLIGFNDAGQVAFMASTANSGANRVVFLSDGKSLRVVAVNGGSVNNFILLAGSPQYGTYYALNNAGQVAFMCSKDNGQPAIWIGDGSGLPQKVVGLGDPSGVTGWGNYTSPFWLRGFDDSGRVLYDSNTTNAPNYALFLKALSDPVPQVVVYRGQQGGPRGQAFFSAEQAAMNNAKVAFLARSANSQWGLYLGSAGAPPAQGAPGTPPDAVAVAIQGDPTPLGGTFGLAGRISAGSFSLSAANQVAFLADIPDLNAAGLFTWTPDGAVTSVVTSMDALPAGANTVLRSGPPSSSDDEILVRVLQAGGQATYYARQIKPEMSGLRKIVAEFDQVPEAGTVISPTFFSMNAKGEVVFAASLLGFDFYPRAGILASLPDRGLVRTVLAGENAPGGGSITSFGPPQINNQTQIAFFAIADTGGGIYLASEATGMNAVARQNNPTWQWPGGGQFASLGNVVALNDNGLVAFRGVKAGTGTQPTGLFVGTSDSIKAVAFTGQDLPAGRIASVPGSVFKLNAAGQVAFVSTLSGAHNGGILLGSGDGPPQPVALAGDAAPSPGKTTYGFFREESIDLNASGQVAFWAGLCCANGASGWFLGSAPDNVAFRLLNGQPLPGGSTASPLAPGNRMAVLADSGEMAIYVADVSQSNVQPQVVIAGTDGQLRQFANNGDKAPGTDGEFAKLFPQLMATPSGRFLLGAALVNGSAKAGIFIDQP